LTLVLMICVHYIYTRVATYMYNTGLDISILGHSIIEIETETHPAVQEKKELETFKFSCAHQCNICMLLVWSPSEGKVSLQLRVLVWHGLTCLQLQIPLVCWRKPKPTILNPVGNWFYYRNSCNSYAVPKTDNPQICSIYSRFENIDSGLW
jgi:hypothetical protein